MPDWNLLAKAYNIDISKYVNQGLIRQEVILKVFGYESTNFIVCA